MKKRLTAMILIMTMLWSSGFEVLPELFSAHAEGDQPENLEQAGVPAFSPEEETALFENMESDVPPAEAVPDILTEGTDQGVPLPEAASCFVPPSHRKDPARTVSRQELLYGTGPEKRRSRSRYQSGFSHFASSESLM